MKKRLRISFFLTTIYTYLALGPFSNILGGSCNAGIVAAFGGVFLFICATLTLFPVINVTRSNTNASKPVLTKILIVLSTMLWGGATINLLIDDILTGIWLFLPLFIIQLITLELAFRKNELLKSK